MIGVKKHTQEKRTVKKQAAEAEAEATTSTHSVGEKEQRHHPTDSLLQPTKRRFFPFGIPNHHHQLRHYISTADPDRIYLASDRTVFAIHVSSQKVETLAAIPFEPKCLTAGYGWIGLGGADNGECAFIKLPVCGGRHSDVDSALPIDLESTARTSSSSSSFASEEAPGSTRHTPRRPLPEVQLHKFGGSIINSVTVHRFPGDGKGLADEDVMVLSNNDKTVTIYSLTRAKVLKVIPHAVCMNYAIISPDSTLLAAVGDENRAYFYEVTRNLEIAVMKENGEKLTGWSWNFLRYIKMDIGTLLDDKCCFTIAFSPSSHLCAIASQSGFINVFDVKAICDPENEQSDDNLVVSTFRSSRFGFDVGAVRCMAFSPEPWDLLVWVEDHGRAGVADARQAFLRRQILDLDFNSQDVQKLSVAFMSDDTAGSAGHFEIRTSGDQGHEVDASQRELIDAIEGLPEDQIGEGVDRTSLREGLIQNLTERELILEFLNTARWTSRTEDSVTGRSPRTHTHATQPRAYGSTEGSDRSSRLPLPLHYGAIHDVLEEMSSGSSDNFLTAARASYPELGGFDSSSSSDNPLQETENRSGAAVASPISALEALSRQSLLQRTSSAPRRPDRPEVTSNRHDRGSNTELRANVAAERLRRQRQLANEVHSRASQWEQRYRQQGSMGSERPRSSRWIRNLASGSPGSGIAHRDQEPGGTAGVGWGADRRSLYIATVDGIFEFQIDVHDRKTFPDLSCR